MERINISIDAETEIRLDFLANITNTNKSKVIRVAIKKLEQAIKVELHNYMAIDLSMGD